VDGLELKNRVAVATGRASGIGKAIASMVRQSSGVIINLASMAAASPAASLTP
jgi:hypothetical protein